jgi:NADH-quinone oxidoreductase subunit H
LQSFFVFYFSSFIEFNASYWFAYCRSTGALVSLIFFICIVLAVLLSVAFFTVFERKVLAAVQGRKGPNFVGFVGILQAIADGLKLFLKETTIPNRASKFLFIFSPVLMFFLSLCG